MQNYRPEIDGLRAVAILPVLLYHTQIPGFSGGYVGVDIFFVISGYLISRQIINDISARKFSFAGFWTRRALRIIPTISVVVAAVLAAGWFLAFPSNYLDIGRSAISQSLFISNIFFWLKAGYFTAPAETKPLLHTWSLSVEEQFYLCIPVLLWVIFRWRDKVRNGILAGLLCGSFVLSVWSSHTHPDAAFYLLHSRAWELLVGCLLASIGFARCPLTSGRQLINEVLSAAGLLSILFSVVLFTSQTPFPGVAALLPCLGTAAIIYSNASQSTRVGRLLSWGVLVWIGGLSYSLYLWHWPMLAFARYSSVTPLSSPATVGIIVASFPMAWLSYRYIETPFRRPVSRRGAFGVLTLAGISLTCLLIAGSLIVATKGAKGRSAFQVDTFDFDISSNAPVEEMHKAVFSAPINHDVIYRLGRVNNTQPKVMLVGDSFSGMYLQSYCLLSEKYDREVWLAKGQNVPYEPDISNAILTGQVADVVLAFSWRRALQAGIPELAKTVKRADGGGRFARMYADWTMRKGYNPLSVIRDTKEPFKRDLERLVRDLSGRGVRVHIVDAPPYYSASVPLKLGLIMKNIGEGGAAEYGSKLGAHQNELNFIHGVFRELEKLDNVRIIRPTDVLCDKSGFCRTYANGHSLYADEAHLSEYGARLMTPILEPIFRRSGN
jgi:peptidoglycan/LPS O-acetylase OafA/YrhL